jgi:hypothetical protein
MSGWIKAAPQRLPFSLQIVFFVVCDFVAVLVVVMGGAVLYRDYLTKDPSFWVALTTTSFLCAAILWRNYTFFRILSNQKHNIEALCQCCAVLSNENAKLIGKIVGRSGRLSATVDATNDLSKMN